MTIHDRAIRMAEEEYPWNFPTGEILKFEGDEIMHPRAIARKAYAMAMEKVLGTLDKCKSRLIHNPFCKANEWSDDRPGRNGKMPVQGPCTCGLDALLTELTNLLDDGQH